MSSNRLAWKLPLFFMATIPLWQAGMGRFLRLGPSPLTVVRQQISSFEIAGLTFAQRQDGQAEVTVRARDLSGGQDGDYTLNEAQADRLGPHPLHLSGGQAVYDPQTGILTVTDAVTIDTQDLKINTEALRYLLRFDTIKSAAPVEITGQGIQLTGTSFRYNTQTGYLRVGSRVKFLYTPPPPAT